MPATIARPSSDLELERSFIESLIGRELRASERAIDILRLNAAMNEAKEQIVRAIEAEKRRAIWRRLHDVSAVDLRLTGPMIAPLERLYQLGRREARAELQRLGYLPARKLASAPRPRRNRQAELTNTLLQGLNQLSHRVGSEYAQADISGLSHSALVSALYSVPGARNIASALVSPALASGLGQTFEENEDLIDGWEYTAVMDDGTCENCEALDGTTYASWADIQEVLPDGGPNPDCLGGNRCRCRPVPAPQR